jgi:hypothetical protein
MKLLFAFVLCVTLNFCFAQDPAFTAKDLSINTFIDGTLLTPNGNNTTQLAIIIAGSGPTDRNGNQNFLKNNALKKLAEGLTNNGIATFRYDKRIVKQILKNDVDPNIRFDDFVTDATSVIAYFKEEAEFKKIYVIGHSQGSLVGMLASKQNVAGFVSLAGAGQTIDEVIVNQVAAMDSTLVPPAIKAFERLKQGETTTDYPAVLGSIFRADVQPFMMNWMQYHPQDIIKNLDIPVLIVNGSKDLQVSVDEAKLLEQASDNADLKIIDRMNHVLFIITGGNLENSKSYNESFRPISTELVDVVSEFIKGH